MKTPILILIIFLSAITNLVAQSWTAQNTGLDDSGYGVEKISIVDANIAWCVSGVYSPIHEFARTTDGGITWIHNVVTPAVTDQYFSGIAAVDSNTAYVCMWSNSGSGGAIYKTIDGGATWSQSGSGTVFTNTLSFPNAIYFWDAAHGFVYGDPIDSTNEIYTTSDSGNTWIQTPATNIPPGGTGTIYSYSVLVVKDSTIWFPTADGYLFKSTDMGFNWTKTGISEGSSINGISFLDDKLNGIAIGANAYRTTDGGATWSLFTPVGAGPYYSISSIPGTDYFVSVTSGDGGRSTYSTDFGTTWTTIDAGTNYYGVAFKDMNTGYAGGESSEGGIYKWDATATVVSELSSENEMLVYPNPVNDLLIVKFTLPLTADSKIKLSNLLGEVVISSSISTEEIQIDMKDFFSGIYFLTVQSKGINETVKVQKF